MKILAFIAHPDDESVGLYTLLDKVEAIILYNPFECIDEERIKELRRLAYDFSIEVLEEDLQIPEEIYKKVDTIAVPSLNSRHIAHKYLATYGSEICKVDQKFNLMFYDVEMIESWSFPLEMHVAEDKREHLLKYYPSQSDLWLSDGKYWLFEGHVMVVR